MNRRHGNPEPVQELRRREGHNPRPKWVVTYTTTSFIEVSSHSEADARRVAGAKLKAVAGSLTPVITKVERLN